jgi:hypothetical protein
MGSNDGLWDKPVVPMPQIECRLLLDADIHGFSLRRGVKTENGPNYGRARSGPQLQKLRSMDRIFDR